MRACVRACVCAFSGCLCLCCFREILKRCLKNMTQTLMTKCFRKFQAYRRPKSYCLLTLKPIDNEVCCASLSLRPIRPRLFTPTLACKSCLQRYCTAEGLIGAFMTGRLWLLRCDVFVRARAYVRACGCECRIISMRKEFSTLSKRDRETNSGVRWFCDGHDGLL